MMKKGRIKQRVKTLGDEMRAKVIAGGDIHLYKVYIEDLERERGGSCYGRRCGNECLLLDSVCVYIYRFPEPKTNT